jgi:hypothetical protein
MAKPKNNAPGAVEINVTANTADAVTNLNKLAAAEKTAEAGAGKLAGATKAAEAQTKTLAVSVSKAGDSVQKSTAKIDTLRAGAIKMAPALKAVGVQAAQAGVTIGGVATAALSAAQAFGPWGIAIGLAATAIYQLVSAEKEAAEATRKHNKEIREQNRELERLRANEALGRLNAASNREQKAFIRQVSGGAQMDEERRAIEDALAEHGSGKSTSALQSELVRLRIKELQISKDQLAVDTALTSDRQDRAKMAERHAAEAEIDAEIAAVQREEELRLLREKGDEERNITKEKKAQAGFGAEIVNQLRLQKAGAFMGRESSDSRAFAEERSNVKDPRLTRPGVKLIDPFSTENEMERIEDESKARIEAQAKALEEAKQAREEEEKKRHKEELARLEQKKAAYEGVGEAVGGALGGIAAISLQAGLEGEKGFKRMLGAWGKMESIKLAAIALSEGVQAVVSAAMWNIPQAIQHGEAAAQAAATAVIVAGMTGAVGGFGSVKAGKANGAFTGDQFGGGSGGMGSDQGGGVPTTQNSQKDQMPTAGGAQYAQAGGSGAQRGGPNIVVHAQVLGAIDDQTGLKLAQGIKRAQRNLGSMGA